MSYILPYLIKYCIGTVHAMWSEVTEPWYQPLPFLQDHVPTRDPRVGVRYSHFQYRADYSDSYDRIVTLVSVPGQLSPTHILADLNYVIMTSSRACGGLAWNQARSSEFVGNRAPASVNDAVFDVWTEGKPDRPQLVS